MKPKIVIEIDGGILQGVYSKIPIDFVLVDLDRRADNTAVQTGSTAHFNKMSEEVRKLVKEGMGPKEWSPDFR